MAETMSPSASMTSGQISKLTDLLSAGLRKAGLPSDVSQQVIETQGDAITKDFVRAFRERVEAITKLVVRRVTVNRTRKPQEVIDVTGRKQYTDRKVVDTMPKGECDGETEVVFFQVGRFVTDADLDKEYELRGLKPADPYSLAAVNEADPTFADEKPNGTHWKDAEDKWCYAAFRRWHGRRGVAVYRFGDGWDDSWWFAGVRK